MLFDVQVQGMGQLQELVKALSKTASPDKIEPELLAGARKMASAIRKRIKKEKTGKLKKSVKAKKLQRWGNNPAPSIAAIDRKIAPHAHLVEYGHDLVKNGKVIGRVKAYPFYRPALDEEGPKILRGVTAALQKKVEGAIK